MVEPQRRDSDLVRTERHMAEQIAPRMFGDRDHMIDLLPAIPHQPVFDATIEIGTGTKFRKQQRLHIVNGGDKLAALPGYAGIIGKMQHIVRADQQRRGLFPNAPAKQRELHHAIAHILARGERVLRLRQQNVIVIRRIDASQRLDQFPGIPPDPHVKILEVPRGNNDLHNVALDQPMVEETRRSRDRLQDQRHVL